MSDTDEFPQPLPTPLALVALIRGADTSEQGEKLLRMWSVQRSSPAPVRDRHAEFAAAVKAGIQPPACLYTFPLPSWVGEGQMDPCRCDLSDGHEGEHSCKHTRAETETQHS